MHNFWSSNRLIYLCEHKIEKGFILLSKLAYTIYILFDRLDYEHIVFCFNYSIWRFNIFNLLLSYKYTARVIFKLSYSNLQRILSI